MVEITPVPQGRKKPVIMQMYKFWHDEDPPDPEEEDDVKTASERVAERYVLATRLHMGPAEVDQGATGSLRRFTPLKAKNRGDLQSACISAGFYAQKMSKTMYVYSGNSYGHLLWRVSDKPGEYLDPISNTGGRLMSVTPDLTVAWHELRRPDMPPSEESPE